MFWLIPVITSVILVVWLFGVRLLSVLDSSNKIIFNGRKRKNVNNSDDCSDARLEENKSIPSTRHCIAITIDDVPWKYSLPKILRRRERQQHTMISSTTQNHDLFISSISEICKILKQHNACATLMMIGNYSIRNLQKNTQLVEKFVEWLDDGVIELANHGMTNSKHASLSKTNLLMEIANCEKAVNDILLAPLNERRKLKRQAPLTSVMTKYYRPGHGFFTQEMVQACQELNYDIVLGNIYSFDPQVPLWWLNFINIALVGYVYDLVKLLSFGFLCSNDHHQIVILHDRPWTAQLLNYLLPFLQWRRYSVLKLSHMMGE
ncbi:hypothetical protein C9374_007868 [Naegleria lovaniensis]|uniref:NodB homology domain-containing protein n=1 Tax=Naegleria lovaniensis TaxID=51637 RepID=A0AA88GKD7_NAELO|nr:uncharacterized protein C9374_007868 [Naegleria lovaniensis]KAG2378720.1 hypothetical protein C9374_007868 [Naegleria lovaniensis]